MHVMIMHGFVGGGGGVQAQLTEQFLAKFFSPWVQWLNLSKTVVFQGSRGGGGIQHFPEDPTFPRIPIEPLERNFQGGPDPLLPSPPLHEGRSTIRKSELKKPNS